MNCILAQDTTVSPIISLGVTELLTEMNELFPVSNKLYSCEYVNIQYSMQLIILLQTLGGIKGACSWIMIVGCPSLVFSFVLGCPTQQKMSGA